MDNEFIVGLRCLETERSEILGFKNKKDRDEFIENLKENYSPDSYVCLKLVRN